MELKKHKLLSLLLAAALLLTAFPATASAAGMDGYSHNEPVTDLVYDISDDAEIIELPTTSGMVGESSVAWNFDKTSGRLTISGSGGCNTFRSAEDQPWAAFRDEITEVWFSDMGDLSIENLAHWFEGCTNLISAEIPYTTSVIGEGTFAGCNSLTELYFYYNSEDDFEIVTGAFASVAEHELSVYVIEDALEQIGSYDWTSDNQIVFFFDVYTTDLLACGKCGGTSYYYGYESFSSSSHWKRIYCSACDSFVSSKSQSHSFSGNTCSLCGYTKACSHSSSYKSWSGCEWYKYCSSCSTLLDSGTSHGTYSYGAWSYYSSSQHRSYYACSDCGEGSYVYASHSTTISYTSSSSTQHTVSAYCSICATTISDSLENHSFTYGDWSNYSDEQHRRTESCTCSYSTYGYGNHADDDGNDTCDSCAYEMTRFSVTVPANLVLTVSKNGKVYAPTNAAIVNNSTGDVAVTGITVTTANGWKLVPYGYNMAAAKVNSKLIGFSVNGAKTTKSGNSEALTLSGNWQIAKGASLSLNYNAVVSATSKPIDQQVLTIMFVVDWV